MDAKKRLETAFELISTIPVSHGSVEVMAKAKEELRAAYAAVNELETALKRAEEAVRENG